MVKRFFVLFASVLCIALSAADIKDTWFSAMCDAVASQLPQGCQLRKDASKRIIFLDMPLPVSSETPFNVATAKAAIVREIKTTPDADFVRKAEIIVIYNYITTDYKIHSVVITKADL